MVEIILSVGIGDVNEVKCWDLKAEESERNETSLEGGRLNLPQNIEMFTGCFLSDS